MTTEELEKRLASRRARFEIKVVEARRAFSELVREQGWSERLVESLEPAFRAPFPTSVEIVHPGLEMPFRPSLYHQTMIAAGMLPIGSCPNGDIVVVNCELPHFPVYYISHEEFDYDDAARDSLLRIARLVAATLSAFLLRAENGAIPVDYWDNDWFDA